MQFLEKVSKNTKYLYIGLAVVLTIIFISLLFFRFPINDEALYLHETYLMTELIKSGQWFGDYGVGVHGFLFKLPLAFVFLFTGPSALVATLYNYLLMAASLYLMFKVSKYFFKSELAIFISVLLLAFSFEFVRSTPTYLREIPSLLSVLLFTYLYLKNSSKWILSVGMLLILDAKEYMFFIIGLAYVLSEFLIFIKDGMNLKKLLELILNYLKVFSPSFIFVVLMFTTSIIPMNMFLASILGLIDKGFAYNAAQFSSDIGATNVSNSGDIKEIFQFAINTGNQFLDSILGFINKIIGYFGKFLYPRSFSYTSIPRLIMIPALVIGFIQFKDWYKNKDKKLIILISILIFMLIFILRNSHGRYLFSISPFIFILLTMFLSNMGKNIKQSILIILFAWLVEFLGLYFETSFAIPKMFISLFILLVYISTLYIHSKKKSLKDFATLTAGVSIGVITMLSSLAFLFTQGQAYYALKFGREFEAQKIVKTLEKYNFIFANDSETGQIIEFYLKDRYIDPLWKWDLKPYVPKQSLAKYFDENKLEVVDDIPYEGLKDGRSVYAVFDSNVKGIEYINEKVIPTLLENKELELIEKIELKGKDLYIFKYNESNN